MATAPVEIYSGALDKGLEGVVSSSTAISSIVDATLLYRGYTIEDLSANSTFEEVVFLLWEGRLPKADELAALRKDLEANMTLSPEQIKHLSSLPTKGVHPIPRTTSRPKGWRL